MVPQVSSVSSMGAVLIKESGGNVTTTTGRSGVTELRPAMH